ncbi:hypothetical protein TNCV_2607341 [Trichonephila clavipes]|uniref:Uncharacterized protein n=1 Tax=Trichonephila clavipes TaxID=2585209 RepID=A0A8X6VCY1_TRICX|nr:hypothetical protein TNCV_2607341 [Trichonephila clavipes]
MTPRHINVSTLIPRTSMSLALGRCLRAEDRIYIHFEKKIDFGELQNCKKIRFFITFFDDLHIRRADGADARKFCRSSESSRLRNGGRYKSMMPPGGYVQVQPPGGYGTFFFHDAFIHGHENNYNN